MKIAVIQMNMKAEDTAYNYRHAEELLCRASQTSPDVIVLPETWNTGFFPKEKIFELADKNGERSKELLSRISRENSVCIIGDSVTEERDGRIYNTSYIYNEKGENIFSYSKTHLFSPMGEPSYYTAGDSLGVFDLKGVRASVLICYDLRFPEAARRLALQGAELLFVPSQWPESRISQMHILLRGRAVENQMFIVSANSCGEYDRVSYGGASLVCDPLGNILNTAGRYEEITVCEITTDTVKEIRSSIPVLRDRRKDIY